ncbi:MAG: iron ABC transporter permease [Armatimonadota bacterium]
MQKSARKVLGVAFCVLVVAFLLHVGIGSYAWVKPWDVVAHIFHGHSGNDSVNDIIWNSRLPRAIEAGLVGAILGVSGSALQTLFRNQIAEPYVVGSSSGAAIGAVFIMLFAKKQEWDKGVFSSLIVTLGMPGAGFITGMLTLMLVMSLARRRGVIETTTLLLAGIVVATMLSSLLTFMILYYGESQIVVLRFMLGSFDTARWPSIYLMAGVFVIAYVVLHRSTQRLNAMSLGEDGAHALGVDPVALRRVVLICVTAMTSVTVGAVGVIGFVGLVAPHIARRLVGSDLRTTLPLSAILGSLLMLIADAIAQRGMQGAGFPVGIVTAIVGAPVLLFLLKRR